MNQSMKLFFNREKITVVGTKCAALSLAEIESMKISDNTNLIYQLAREALKEFSNADGLYIAGGSMVSFPIVEPLEKEFGKPVILNVGALSWTLCHQLNFWTPVPGKGRLLASQ